MDDIFIISAVRTAIGAFGGALKNHAPGDLGSVVAKEAIQRASVDPALVDLAVFGMVLSTEPRDAYLARVAALGGGVGERAPALSVNRLCGSGLQAIVSAAQSLMLGDGEIALAGGVEVMSRAPFYAPDVRWGRKMGDGKLIDGLNGVLTDPFHRILMGVTAENVAQRYGVTREAQDALAAESHRRAAAAIERGYFEGQIVPVEVKRGRSVDQFRTDEHVRAETTVAELSGLRPIFIPENGTVTAGNASGINDGAAALILATGSAVSKYKLKPMARLVAYGHAGVEPAYMGIGPVPATRSVLERAKLQVGDIDVVEANEAFAAQACAVSSELDLDPAKVNPNGSGIGLGHPVGATGAIISVKLIHELQRTNGRYGLATMCIGGGQGISAIFERVDG